MKKNVNKLVAFAIGISVMSGSVIPAFAADVNKNTDVNVNQNVTINSNQNNTANAIYVQNQENKKPLLTLKEAIKSAIDNSEKLALKAKEIKLYKDKIDIQENLDDLNEDSEDDSDFPYDKLEILLKQSKEQKEYMKDQISQDITNKYNDLVTKENALTKLNKQLEIKSKQISDIELKKKLGMVITTDAQTAETELQALKNSKQAKENQLKNSQEYFEVLTDKDPSKYSLEQDQDYEVFRIKGSQDEYFDEIIEKYKKYDEKLLHRTKEHLDDTKTDKPDSDDKPDKDSFNKTIVNPTDGTTSKVFDEAGYQKALQDYKNEWNTYGNYLEQKYQYNSSVFTLNDSKKSLKDGLKQSYANLLDMENGINLKKTTIQIKNKELSNAKLKYDMGLMIKTDYDTLILNIMDLETDLRSSINNYNTLKNEIQKPWLLTGGASAAGSSAGMSSAGQ